MAAWTNEEVAFLTANFPTMSNPDLAKAMGRTVESVCCKAERLGITCSKSPVLWANAHRQGQPPRTREERLAVAREKRRLKFRADRGLPADAELFRGVNPWTDAHKAYVRDAWPTTSIAAIANALGRSERGVSRMGKSMGLPSKAPPRSADGKPGKMHPLPRPKPLTGAEAAARFDNARAEMKKRPGALFFRAMGAW